MKVKFKVLQVIGEVDIEQEAETVEKAKEKIKAMLADEKIVFFKPNNPHVIMTLSAGKED